MSERDKFLTEAMGEKWFNNWTPHKNDFSTWAGFGKLKSFMEKHELRVDFWDNYLDHIAERTDVVVENFERITPDSLATFACEFLKERTP